VLLCDTDIKNLSRKRFLNSVSPVPEVIAAATATTRESFSASRQSSFANTSELLFPLFVAPSATLNFPTP